MTGSSSHREGLIVCLGFFLGLIVAGASAAWWLAGHDDEMIFLGGGPARWIVAPTHPQTMVRPSAPVTTFFERSFDVSTAGAQTLRVRALGKATVSVNDRVVLRPHDFPSSWKRIHTLDVGPSLKSGSNVIRVSVVSAGKPAALNLALDGVLETDESWLVSLGGSSPRPARAATDRPRLDPGMPGTVGTVPLSALARSLPQIGLFALLMTLVVVAVRRLSLDSRLAAGVVVIAWVALYLNNADSLPLTAGFDTHGHLDYIRYILDGQGLPLANEGWQMYQPPLFYLVCAAVLKVFSSASFDAHVLRAITFSAGIAQVLMLGQIARLLWPRRPLAWILALGFGAFLPMHLYLFHFASNETLAMTMNTAVSMLVVRLLTRETIPSLKSCLGVGVLLGLAMLTKFSALVLFPVVLAALGFQFARSGAERSATLVRLGCLLGASALACGWHFGRVWSEFGNPLIGNWEPTLGFTWWQDPGYRTIADYLSFGRSLTQPWYGGFAGVLDGVYSTLWGDALASGTNEVKYGAPWNHPLVSAGYVFSLVPSLAILSGCAIGFWRLVRGQIETSRYAAIGYLVGLAVVVIAALVIMTLRVPSYAQSKAFYIQPALPALCVAFVFGSMRLLDAFQRFRSAGLVLLGTCGVVFYASVWILPEAAAAKVQAGYMALATRDAKTADALFREALARDPEHAGAHTGLALALSDPSAARAAAERALDLTSSERHPALTARALHAAARSDLAMGNLTGAEESLRRAIKLAPNDRPNYGPLARLLLEQGRASDAVAVLREQLWIDPSNASVHQWIADIENDRDS